jgi:hypothetical protein
VIVRLLTSICVVVLAAVAVWLLRPADWAHRGATLEPPSLTLRPGERRVVRLVNNEPEVVALRFRLRFDESVMVVEGVEPEHRSILTGGNAISFPARHGTGTVEVSGSAVTGGRVLAPFAPVYRLTVLGVNPGTTTIEAEDLTIVDLGNARRTVSVSPSHVTVREP